VAVAGWLCSLAETPVAVYKWPETQYKYQRKLGQLSISEENVCGYTVNEAAS